MRKLGVAILLASMAVAACSTAVGAPVAPTVSPPGATQASAAATAMPGSLRPSAAPRPSASPKPSIAADRLPDAFIGAWYHPSPAYWWFLRAGSPTCLLVAHTDLDCVTYQLGAQAAFVGAAAMDGRLIRIHWTRGYCAGQETDFGTGLSGGTLKLFDTEGDCGGEDLVLSRAGKGATPTAPPPPQD